MNRACWPGRRASAQVTIGETGKIRREQRQRHSGCAAASRTCGGMRMGAGTMRGNGSQRQAGPMRDACGAARVRTQVGRAARARPTPRHSPAGTARGTSECGRNHRSRRLASARKSASTSAGRRPTSRPTAPGPRAGSKAMRPAGLTSIQANSARRCSAPTHSASQLREATQRTSWLAACASRVTSAQSCAASAAFGVSHEPPTQTTFGCLRKSGAVCALMPPVGQNFSVGNGP